MKSMAHSGFVRAKTGEDVLVLWLSAGSDCLGTNVVVTVQVGPYQKSRCTRHKANKNTCDHKALPLKGRLSCTQLKGGRTGSFSVSPSMNRQGREARESRV